MKMKCFCCATTARKKPSDNKIPAEEQNFDQVKEIWKEKMLKSEIFFPQEIGHIVDVWIQFTRQQLKRLPNVDAQTFCSEAAECAAERFKYNQSYGWDCLITEFPFDYQPCDEDHNHNESKKKPSLTARQRQSTQTPPQSQSAHSFNDSLAQLEFLLQLVSSSNFTLHLVRTALDSSFRQKIVMINSPQLFLKPRTYLELDCSIKPTTIRQNLLHGEYNSYILPLQISNEVDDDFWVQIQTDYNLN